MENKLKLNVGDRLKQINHKMKGYMQETDIWTYEIIDKNGKIVGSVIHTDKTEIKGLHRTQTLEQKDNLGNIIVSISW